MKEDTRDPNIDDAENSQFNDDIEFDDSNEKGLNHKFSQLRNKLKSCEDEKKDYLLGWQRSKADFINAKKEFEQERQRIVSYAEYSLIEDLIIVLDSFFMAKKNESAWKDVKEEWRMGVEYIEQQLISTLTSRGLSFIEPTVNSPFNHEVHEAVREVEGETGKIAEVLARGYKFKDKLLRPAKVVVGK